ncbi:hypothetical protein [Streptomyces blastmyceticus]|uniref:Uncharacterized protein n=1 Tax=Streptomyces blastmyceticus TaxID=68180 RepID=A0ABN0WXR6_9ACTN
MLHGIPEVTDNADLRNVLRTIGDNLKADKDLTGNPHASFMMGVLEAEIKETRYYFVASSGNYKDSDTEWTQESWIQSEHLKGISYHRGKWTMVNPTVPNGSTGWLTVRGAKVGLDAGIPDVGKKCSAIKLLLALGNAHPDWGTAKLHMSEMVYVGSAATSPRMRKWHGEGATNSWTAHSCDACEARIPYLICDVPDNRFTN